MISLKSIYEALAELEVIQSKKANYHVSFFGHQKRINIAKTNQDEKCGNIEKLSKKIQNKFNVLKVTQHDDHIFTLQFDGVTNMENVHKYIKSLGN